MARAIKLIVNNLPTIWANDHGISPKVAVMIDGKMIPVEVPDAIPEPKGMLSKVKASKIGSENHVITWTKIGPNKWFTEERVPVGNYDHSKTEVCTYHQLQVYEVIEDTEETAVERLIKPPLEEPSQIASVAIDNQGREWVRICTGSSTEPWRHALPDDKAMKRSWSAIESTWGIQEIKFSGLS